MATEEHDQKSAKAILGVENDFPEARPTMPYMIMSAPRTGSSMLSSALAGTRLAGHPMEYLHERYLRIFRQQTGKSRLGDYLTEIVRRRTSPNGLFGIKIQYFQFRAVFDSNPAAGAGLAKSFKRFVRLRRQDKLDQAISWMLAKERQIWNTDDAASVPAERHFQPDDVAKIRSYMARAANGERYWDSVIASLSLAPILEVVYEDLRAEPQRETARILAFLGVELPAEQVPLPRTVKISGEGSREIKSEYLRSVGMAAA